jgi:hypothetical protein
MKSLEYNLVALVRERRLEPAIIALALLPNPFDDEAGPDGVADDSWLQKAAALFDEDKTFDPLAGVGGAKRRHPDQQQAVR